MKIKKNKFKKFLFLSILSVFSLGTSVYCSGSEFNSSNTWNNDFKTIKNAVDVQTNSSVSPEVNDLYNDYSYDQGFVSIANGSIVNFYDWFGLKIWSFDVAANSNLLFGAKSEISSLKVKSYNVNSQIFIYGTLNDSRSFVFRLNVIDGALVPFGSLNAFVSSNTESNENVTDLIKNINLLVISNNYAILTPKTPTIDDESGTSKYLLNFSVLDINQGSIVTKTIDISSMSSLKLGLIGEIIFVQKVNNDYSFGIKVERRQSNPKAGHRACVAAISIKNDTYSSVTSFSLVKWTANQVDLDKSIFCIQDISISESEQRLIISMKYDTTSITYTPNDNQTYIGLATLNSTGFVVDVQNYVTVMYNGSASTSNIAGITGFLFDRNLQKPYVVLANNTSTSTFAIAPLTFDASTSTAEGWIDLSNIVETSQYQIMNIGFIPGSSKDNRYFGYLQIEKQDDNTVSEINSETRVLFALDSPGTTLSVESNINFSFGMSDSQISQKYNSNSYSANEETRNALLTDLTKVEQNNSTYPVEINSDNLVVDTKNNTIKGEVTFSLNNWWNSDKSQITSNVNLNFNSSESSTATSNSSIADANVMIYSSVVLGALLLIASALIFYKVIQARKIKDFKED